MEGIAIHCPNKKIMISIMEQLKTYVPPKEFFEDYFEKHENDFCLAIHRKHHYLWGTLKFNLSEEGKRDWVFYRYTNNIIDILREKEPWIFEKGG